MSAGILGGTLSESKSILPILRKLNPENLQFPKKIHMLALFNSSNTFKFDTL